MSATTRRVIRRIASSTSAQSVRSSWNVSSRPCARGTQGVASTGLESTPLPSRWNHGPIVGPSSAASSRASEPASCSTVSMPSAASFLAVLPPIPHSARVGRCPISLNQVSSVIK